MGECLFWYRPTRVVPDQRPLNGRRRHTKCIVLQTRWTLTDNGTRCDGVEDDVKSVGLLRSCMNRA